MYDREGDIKIVDAVLPANTEKAGAELQTYLHYQSYATATLKVLSLILGECLYPEKKISTLSQICLEAGYYVTSAPACTSCSMKFCSG